MKNVDVEIVEPAAPSSQIRVRSAAVGDDYFPEPDHTKLGDDVFIPDDLLVCDRDGFRIVGRVSDVINVAGKKGIRRSRIALAAIQGRAASRCVRAGIGIAQRRSRGLRGR